MDETISTWNITRRWANINMATASRITSVTFTWCFIHLKCKHNVSKWWSFFMAVIVCFLRLFQIFYFWASSGSLALRKWGSQYDGYSPQELFYSSFGLGNAQDGQIQRNVDILRFVRTWPQWCSPPSSFRRCGYVFRQLFTAFGKLYSHKLASTQVFQTWSNVLQHRIRRLKK